MAAGCGVFVEKAKPYIAMISLQFGYAGMNVLTKVSLNNGMSHYVLVVYRHAFATLSIAPFALVLERKVRPKMTWPIFWQIFVLAMLGMTGVLSFLVQAGDRPELLLRRAQVHRPNVRLRHEQHPAGHDLRPGSDLQDGEAADEEGEVPGQGARDGGDRGRRDADDALQGPADAAAVDHHQARARVVVGRRGPRRRRGDQRQGLVPRLGVRHRGHPRLGLPLRPADAHHQAVLGAAVAHHARLLHRHPAGHRRHLRHGAPHLRLDHRLRHEPSRRRLRRHRDVEHRVLRARSGDPEDRAGVRVGVQPAHDDHRRRHGILHPLREDLPRGRPRRRAHRGRPLLRPLGQAQGDAGEGGRRQDGAADDGSTAGGILHARRRRRVQHREQWREVVIILRCTWSCCCWWCSLIGLIRLPIICLRRIDGDVDVVVVSSSAELSVRLATTSTVFIRENGGNSTSRDSAAAAVWKLEWRIWHELWEEFCSSIASKALLHMRSNSKHAGFITKRAHAKPNSTTETESVAVLLLIIIVDL